MYMYMRMHMVGGKWLYITAIVMETNGYVIEEVTGISAWIGCKSLHDWIYGNNGIKGYV